MSRRAGESLDTLRRRASRFADVVTPTLLELLDVPVGEDMKGRVLTEWLADGVSRAGSVPSHDTPEWLAARGELDARRPRPDAERMKQLRALGYID